MRTSRKILSAIAVSLGLLAPTALTSALTTAPAQAAYDGGCVGYYEWFDEARTTYTDLRTHSIFGTTGVRTRWTRTGWNGRKLDTWRTYRSCGYPDDSLIVNFDDYTAPGTLPRGGYLRVYDGLWEHYCVDSEELYDDAGYNYGYRCGDTYWAGEYSYEDLWARTKADGLTAKQHRDPASTPITRPLGKTAP